jgi:UDP-glucose-4-epimerase GalE
MLVYSGSCAIYGVPDEVPVDESSAPKPMNPYGESKWLAEEEIRTASAEWGLRSCILRYFNAAGAELDGSLGEKLDHSANLIPVVMRAALGLIPHVPVYGLDYDTPDGSAIRDYVHVQDLARAHLLALDYLSAGGATTAVNVGTGSGHSVLDVLAEAEQTTQRPIEIRNEGRRAGDAPAIWADTALAHQVLNWKSELELPDIIRSAWIWHSRQHGADH